MQRPLSAVWVSTRPRVLRLEGFLSSSDCASLRNLTEPRLESCTVDAYRASAIRTSSGCWLPRSDLAGAWSNSVNRNLVAKIEARIERVSGVPLDHGEPLQALRYRAGESYKMHVDYLGRGDGDELSRAGQRVATLLVYLATLPDKNGGATLFPRSRRVGPPLRIQPVEGDAILWWNTLPNGAPDPLSRHASEAVRRGQGALVEKWALSKWLRARPLEIDEDAAAAAGF